MAKGRITSWKQVRESKVAQELAIQSKLEVVHAKGSHFKIKNSGTGEEVVGVTGEMSQGVAMQIFKAFIKWGVIIIIVGFGLLFLLISLGLVYVKL